MKVPNVSVYARGNKLHIRYTIPGTGERIREATGYDNDKEGWDKAGIKAQSIKLSLMRREDRIKNNRICFSEAYQVFIKNREKKTPNTANYLYTKNEIIKYGDKILTEYNEDFFLDLKSDLLKRVSYNTVVNYLNHARTMFIYFTEKKWIEKNPVPKFTSVEMPIIIISPEDIKKIFEYYKGKDFYNYIKMLYLSGFRRSEAISIKRKDILFDRKKINIFNSKKNRWELFPMIRGLDKFLTQYEGLKPDDTLFPINPHQATNIFRKGMIKLEMNYSLHDFRRTFGTEEAKNYMPAELMRLMRHKDIKTTMKYYVEADLDKIQIKSSKPEVEV